MAFTLTLLGTDTEFTPDQAGDYDKAETLSYISTLIRGRAVAHTPYPLDAVTKYRTPAVAVINGPTTKGTEVGDRVARGVAAILEAISRGEKDISIIAHSRGAVEAILVAHELERIQTQLAANSSEVFKPEFCNSVCPYTKPAMTSPPHQDTFEKLNWAGINANIKNVKLSMFNIDPVPGGNFVGVSRLSHVAFRSLAWRDPRFYVVPKIVKEYKQVIYENERTRCFKPIVPKCASPDTVFKLDSLPGHHGTGSGNLLDQQRGKNGVNPHDGTGEKTKHVQELVVVELIDFLTRNDVNITPRARVPDPFAELIFPLFSPGFTPIDELYKTIYLELFNHIMANKEAYQHYNKTSYRVLGQEQSFQRKLWATVDQRIVHHQAHNNTFLEAIVPRVPGGNFLNYEHARLFLNKQLGLKEGAKLDETINTAVARLLEISRHAQELNSPKDSPMALLAATTSAVGDKFAVNLESDNKIEDLLLEGVGALIEKVRQTYVRNKLAPAVYDAVISAFREFEQFTTEYPDNKIAKKILDAFKLNVENTLDMKHKALKDHYRDLANRMQDGKVLKDLHYNVQQIIRELQAKQPKIEGETKPADDEGLLLDYLTNFAAEILKHDPQEMDTQQFLFDNNVRLSTLELNSRLAQDSQQAVAVFMTQAAEDLEETNLMVRVQNRIHEVIAAHNDLDEFKKSLPGFKELNGSINNEEREASIDEYKYRLAFVTAQYIVENTIPVNSVEVLFGVENQKLYQQIKNLAIAFGAVNPLTLNIQQKVRVIFSLHEQLKRQYLLVKIMAANDKEKDLMIKALQAERDEQAEQIRSLTTNGNDLTTQIKALTEQSEKLVQEKQALTETELRLTDYIGRLTTKDAQQTRTIAGLREQSGTLAKDKVLLIDTEKRLTRELEILTTKDGVQTKEIASLTTKVEAQSKEIKSLSAKAEGLSKDKDSLAAKIVEQAKAIEKLTSDRTKQATEIEKLTSDRAQQAKLIKQLTTDSGEQAKMVEALTSEKAQQAQLIKGMELAADKQQKLIEQLTTDKLEQDALIKELQGAKQDLAQQVEQLLSQVAGMKEQQKGFFDSNDDFENAFNDIVRQKLMPLTKDYLQHLAKEIRRNVDSKLDITDFQKLAKNVEALKWPKYESSQLLKEKFAKLSALNDILYSKNLPSEKVTQFYQQLNEAEKTLAEHRDPWWQRYLANTVKVLATIITGVIPGLAVFGIKFWQSSGQAFFKEAKKVENDKPEPESGLTASSGIVN